MLKGWLENRQIIAHTTAAVPGVILLLAAMQQALVGMFRTRVTAGLGVGVGDVGKCPLRT